jgi:16S rRNA (uracil1498-N3)-methyltransferase
MSERFFLSSPPVDAAAWLEGDEARHLTRVMRARVGDLVELFDGCGHVWTAEIHAIGKGRVQLLLRFEHPQVAAGDGASASRATRPSLSMATALPKGDRQRWMIEKLTELGVERLVPLVTARGVAEATPSAIARLSRTVIEACKQCRRTELMEIAEPMTLEAVIASRGTDETGLLADPQGVSMRTLLGDDASKLLCLIGPEGGFTDGERRLAEAGGFRAVCLGRHVLRVETAAVAVAAVVAGG